jgi:hypothetical protein
MKKLQFSGFMATLLLAFIFFSCSKNETASSSDPLSNNENDDLKRNEATWVSSDPSKGLPQIKIKIFLGHTVNDCGGTCVKIFGVPMHIDCRGFGNVCNHIVSALLSDQGGMYILTLTDPDALGAFLDFDFPDRSLFITNPLNSNELWLNIPEQLLIKDEEEDVFVIHNIWFSENPELENP